MPDAARPPGPLVWVHAASVGETVAVLPLIERLVGARPGAAPDHRHRHGGAGRAAAASGAARSTSSCRSIRRRRSSRFLDHWRPGLALFAESELWPTMLRALRRARACRSPSSMPACRSARSAPGALRAAGARRARARRSLPGAVRRPMRSGSARSARSRVVVCGNLKFDVPPPPADPVALEACCDRISAGGRCWSRRARIPARKTAVIAAHKQLRRRRHAAPHHPCAAPPGARRSRRGADRRGGLSRRPPLAAASRIAPATDIYLADTIGEMGLWYRLADVAFLGGSMVPHGGQNPIEPAKLGVPILHGEPCRQFPRRL